MRIILAFVAGALSVPFFHQVLLWILHAAGIVPMTSFKVGGRPPHLIGLFVVGFLLNAAWGIGWALLLHLFERMRGA